MLGDHATIEAVAEALDDVPRDVPVVLDPVMVSESGARLLEESAIERLIALLLPRVSVVTPNVPEAKVLAKADYGAVELARAIHALGPAAVVVTGGHREQAVDVFFDGERLEQISGPRHSDGAAHGSGCTHSSVLAARLAAGDDPLEAARMAKRMASRAVRDGLQQIGSGAGPVDVLGLPAATAPERTRRSAGVPLT
jgi:hydroxymethylpyrimidine/phosphomethylpyrimidine kinase